MSTPAQPHPPERRHRRRRHPAPALLALALLLAAPARGTVPYPACALPACDPACPLGDGGCTGPDDYADYLFLGAAVTPDDLVFDPNAPAAGDAWLFQGLVSQGPAAGVVIGHDVVGAWGTTTGRPDVVAAVLDSGIRWRAGDVARKVALHTGELPLPPGCDPSFDCNADGVVNVDDFAGAPCGPGLANSVSDAAGNQNGLLDAQDLILACSDGVDDDDNAYVDDIAGWDFHEDDNDPFDDVDYGHGSGQASDQVAEADNGAGTPGIAPASMFLPIKVADSFVGIGSDFAQAVVYATDRGVALISEALGTVSAGPAGQAAIDYAYRRGVPVVASAADEQSRHHNYPANYEHTIWVNSVRPADGELIAEKAPPEFTLQNGCTNHGGRAFVAIASKSCSSEATGRAAGLVSLLIAHGRNLIDRGELAPYPGLTAPFSAEEVRQILRAAAVDIDHSPDPTLSFTLLGDLLAGLLSAPGLGLVFDTGHFDTAPAWDQYTGYGRPDAVALVSVSEDTIPPEVDLSGGLRWFEAVDPARAPQVPIVASAAAVRAPGSFGWTLEVGCGVQPTLYVVLASGSSAAPLRDATLHLWDPAATASLCAFDPAAPIEDPDAHTVTLRLRVVDARGNRGEDRRVVSIHSDASLRFAPIHLGTSGEASPTLTDIDGDRVLDIVYGTAAGEVHVRSGATGASLPGFPALTNPLPVHDAPAYQLGEVPVPRETLLASTAADDLDRDGVPEIVAASVEGGVYVFDAQGALRAGFPVYTDPARSDPALRDPFNDLDPGISGAPTLVDLDPPGADPALEIVAGAWDGHLYAWRADGAPVAGFPVRVADTARLDLDPVTGAVTPLDGGARRRLAKIVSSPAVGDLDGDGLTEIVVTTNEEYAGEPTTFGAESGVLQFLQAVGGLVRFDVAGRIHVRNHDGTPLTSVGGQPTSWPAPVPLLDDGVLPNVATGVPGSPALADVDGDGALEVAVFGSVGPVMLFDATGVPRYPPTDGAPTPMALDFPGVDPQSGDPGFPAVPPEAGSADAPFFATLGSGAFGDVDGDPQRLPEYAAPTAGLRMLIEVQAPGHQAFSEHQLTVWRPQDGALLPAFPRPMDDMQFFSSPTLADVSGDGVADVLNGSGAYLLRAYRADGATPAGFPKFTHGWLIGAAAVGDVDGDERNEVVAATREGDLFVWDTPGITNDAAIPWQTSGRDRRNTQNLASRVATTVDAPGRAAGGAAALVTLFLLARRRRARR